jgi:hypothetical protein
MGPILWNCNSCFQFRNGNSNPALRNIGLVTCWIEFRICPTVRFGIQPVQQIYIHIWNPLLSSMHQTMFCAKFCQIFSSNEGWLTITGFPIPKIFARVLQTQPLHQKRPQTKPQQTGKNVVGNLHHNYTHPIIWFRGLATWWKRVRVCLHCFNEQLDGFVFTVVRLKCVGPRGLQHETKNAGAAGRTKQKQGYGAVSDPG